ncbi:MAG TPA: putative Ig domain-containing protein [Acidimicrobiales bacterium]|nr:putative Ig domain-containing protein [Acidimicrobiales bacterium]
MRKDDGSPSAGHVPRRRLAWALGVAALSAATVTGATAGTAAAGTAAGSQGSGAIGLSDPTGGGHAYRHGALPLRTGAGHLGAAAVAAPSSTSPQGAGQGSRGPLRYRGGPVVTGSPRVYLVFWGSQWGTPSTGAGGYQHFSGDPDGLAPDLQAFFAGLGTDGELWSATVTQYCRGTTTGAKACPVAPGADHVAFPGAGVLGGVWEDTSITPPQGAFAGDSSVGGVDGTQLAQEAADAAVHFGDSSSQAQFVIVSPPLTNPDGWLDPRNGYCAYHDNSGDPFFAGHVTGPAVAYTNFPYIPDAGVGGCASTGMNGVLDGVNETASHEYAETLTDPDASTGWLDRRGNEIADKCDYVSPGLPGAAVYLTLATGTFDVQGLWANDSGRSGGCEVAHSAVLVTAPGNERSVTGAPVSVPMTAVDVRGQTLGYAAVGLPAGLSINPTSGVVSGIPMIRGRTTVTVTVSDTSSTASVRFKWVVSKH